MSTPANKSRFDVDFVIFADKVHRNFFFVNLQKKKKTAKELLYFLNNMFLLKIKCSTAAHVVYNLFLFKTFSSKYFYIFSLVIGSNKKQF